MTNITNAAQDDQALAALDRLVETYSRNYHPFANPLTSDAQSALRHIRAALQDKAGEVADFQSRSMFVARLENMQANGDAWLTVPAVLALLNDCDMIAAAHQKGDPV